MNTRNEFSSSLVAIFLNRLQHDLALEEKDLADLAIGKIRKLLPDNTIYCNREIPGTKTISAENETDFLQKISALLPPSTFDDEDIDEVFFCYMKGLMPVLDPGLTTELLQRHIRYLSQYSWSENIPAGLVPYFVSREFVNTLDDNSGSVHEFLIKNINNYDVEIFFHPPDYRQHRLDFTLSSPRSAVLIKHFAAKQVKYEDILTEIQSSPEIFRPFPSWIELEIVSACDYTCTFCPRQFRKNPESQTMSFDTVKKLVSDIRKIPDQLTVCLGGMGEPLLHKEFTEVAREILSLDNLAELVVETSLSCDTTALEKLLAEIPAEAKEKISVIVNLVTLDAAKYKSIYGKDSLKDVLGKVEKVKSLLKPGNLHAQTIKMKELEEETESYFNHFEKQGINVILQKYNRYADLMPEKRVSDLTPIKRDFCWHLVRDLYISSDGSVAVCRIKMDDANGNCNDKSLQEIWDNAMPFAALTLNGKTEEIPAPCQKCDEWYTFNA